MGAVPKIRSSDDAWESGDLGRNEEFAKLATDVDEGAIDEALELQLISVRLQKGLIEGLKEIAKMNGIGYQPLMRQVLHRFVDAEFKRIVKEMMAAPPAPARRVAAKRPAVSVTRHRKAA